MLGRRMSTSLGSFAYTLAPSGNRIGLSETISSTVARAYAWQYDKLYRLTNETVTGSIPSGTLSYQYDSVGNRLSWTGGLGLLSQSLNYGIYTAIQAMWIDSQVTFDTAIAF
jgi:hypothetical protein